MAKTNFTKVEEALAEGMRKIEVNRLLGIADENAAIAANSEKTNESSSKAPSKVDAVHLKRLSTVLHELKALEKIGKDPYVRLKLDKDEMEKFLKDPSSLNYQDWEKIKAIKQQIVAYKAELQKKTVENSNDDLVKQQRKKQITKRFNINEKWIPLR